VAERRGIVLTHCPKTSIRRYLDLIQHVLTHGLRKKTISQSLSEFPFIVTRKDKLPPIQAKNQVEGCQALFLVVAAGPAALNRTIGSLRMP